MNHSTASASLAERFEPRSETDTRLYGYWLVLVRLVCLTLCVLSVGLYVASVLSYIANHYCTGTAAACHPYGPIVVRTIQGPGLGIYTIVRDSIFALGYWLSRPSSSGASRTTVWRSWPPSPWAPFQLCSIMALLAPFPRPGGSRPIV